MFSILSFLLQLNRLQAVPRMSRDEIHALQEARWRRLLRYAHDHSSFYRERFHGLDLSRCRPADLAPLGKVEMMANFDALVTDRRIRRADVAQFIADPANLGKSYLRRYASSRPWAHRAAPRLVWAGAESGCRRTPSRRLRTARSTFPCPARAMPRLTWALAKSGFRRNASW